MPELKTILPALMEDEEPERIHERTDCATGR